MSMESQILRHISVPKVSIIKIRTAKTMTDYGLRQRLRVCSRILCTLELCVRGGKRLSAIKSTNGPLYQRKNGSLWKMLYRLLLITIPLKRHKAYTNGTPELPRQTSGIFIFRLYPLCGLWKKHGAPYSQKHCILSLQDKPG